MKKLQEFFKSIQEKFIELFGEESRLYQWWGSLLDRLPWDAINRNKQRIIVISSIAAVLLISFFVSVLRTYKNYTVRETYEISESSAMQYLGFKNNLLKYGPDGAFYTNYSGDLIWNETYDMSDVAVDVCGDYLVLYDKGGTSAFVMTTTGRKGKVTTNFPIVSVNVANKGTIAVLMQQQDSGYIQIYDVDGNVLASGELHLENSGYPIAIALSDNAKTLAVSMIDVSSGKLTTNINFYSFTKSGKKATDNIVGRFSYEDRVIPQLEFVSNSKCLAFTDQGAIIFTGASKPRESKVISLDKTINSVFSNEKYFGFIYDDVDDEGLQIKKMALYTMNGFKKFDKKIDSTYTHCEMLDTNDIVLVNQNKLDIYTKLGIHKFSHNFDTELYKVIEADGRKDYIFVRNGVLEDAHIK